MTVADPRRPLAALRYGANLAIDRRDAGLPDLVRLAVLRHVRTGPDGIPRLDRVGAALAYAEIERLALGRVPGYAADIAAGILAAERLAEKQAREVIG